MTRDDLELYVTGNYDGDIEALEAKIAADPELQRALAAEARLEGLLGDAAAAATFCPACGDVVRDARCEMCGVAVRPGGYTVERVLVGNAHGRMYVAHDVDGKQVALKELAFVQSPTLAAIAAFEREVKILRALEHPAIPTFCASFEEGRGVHTRYYLAQQLVDGEALDARLSDHWYTEAEIVEIATQVLEVLVYLQALTPMVIHRDIKPANLLRRKDGTLAVVDFGAAHVQGATAGSTSIGTFGYMPIEQLAGIVDATTDLYALGASLVHLLTRQEPWRVVPLAATTPLNVSEPLRAFLEKLVAPLPADRFPSAEAALAALRTRDLPKPRPKARGFDHPRRPAWIIAATLAAALVTGAAGYGVYKLTRSEPAMTPPDAMMREAIPQTPMDAALVPLPAPRLPLGPPVNFDFKNMPLVDGLKVLADTCHVSIVMSGDIKAMATTLLSGVPCNQAIESLLESNGLWYAYVPDSKLVRVDVRKAIDDERMKIAMGTWHPDDPLPVGRKLDLEVVDAPLDDALRTVSGAAGINFVLPSGINGKVTVFAHGVPWDDLLRGILDASGLSYRYSPDRKILRIDARNQLDHEAAHSP